MKIHNDIKLLEKAVYRNHEDMTVRQALADAYYELGDTESYLFWFMTWKFKLMPIQKTLWIEKVEKNRWSWNYDKLDDEIHVLLGVETPGLSERPWYKRASNVRNAFKRLRIGFDSIRQRGFDPRH